MPRIRAVRVVLSLVLFLVAATAALPRSPQKPAVALSGMIFSDGTNQRIARASIALCDNGGIVVQESPADDGEFSFQGLQPAHYILKVQATGFDSVGVHIDLTSTSPRGVSLTVPFNQSVFGTSPIWTNTPASSTVCRAPLCLSL